MEILNLAGKLCPGPADRVTAEVRSSGKPNFALRNHNGSLSNILFDKLDLQTAKRELLQLHWMDWRNDTGGALLRFFLLLLPSQIERVENDSTLRKQDLIVNKVFCRCYKHKLLSLEKYSDYRKYLI